LLGAGVKRLYGLAGTGSAGRLDFAREVVTNHTITETILELLGVGWEMVQHGNDRLGHDRRYSVTTSKVRALDWQPERDFREALAETVPWYRENEAWWKALPAVAIR